MFWCLSHLSNKCILHRYSSMLALSAVLFSILHLNTYLPQWKSSDTNMMQLWPNQQTSFRSDSLSPYSSADLNECRQDPDICGQGRCYNSYGGYSCGCFTGYRFNSRTTKCEGNSAEKQCPKWKLSWLVIFDFV